ncbi:MAG: PTS sugar transporter subunit IIA [Deltaproteobacteria bacterium]|nr:PTS sugar transporter subunit IIA [Deltaproteobacteria bacterium]
MRLLDSLAKDSILPDINSQSKEGVLKALADTLTKASGRTQEELVQVLVERERLGSTGIGGGIAIPHGKVKTIDKLLLAFGRSRKGVDFDAMDGKPTHLFFVLITPEGSTGVHLKMLARISRLLKDGSFKERLMVADTRDDLYQIIQSEDSEF